MDKRDLGVKDKTPPFYFRFTKKFEIGTGKEKIKL